MIELGDITSAVFDCDGVILNSNRIKTAAFAKVLQGYPEALVTEFVRFHQSNGGVSRYAKLRHFFERIAKVSNVEQCMADALASYAEVVEAELSDCSLIPGIEAYLERLTRRGVACSVNSGGDEAELHRVFGRRNLRRWFVKILGSPPTKAENMERLRALGFSLERCAYFGDSASDWNTATQYGCQFIFVSRASEWREGAKCSAEHKFPTIEDFSALSSAPSLR